MAKGYIYRSLKKTDTPTRRSFFLEKNKKQERPLKGRKDLEKERKAWKRS